MSALHIEDKEAIEIDMDQVKYETHLTAKQQAAQDVLDKLDNKQFGFFHVKMIVVSYQSDKLHFTLY